MVDKKERMGQNDSTKNRDQREERFIIYVITGKAETTDLIVSLQLFIQTPEQGKKICKHTWLVY